MYTVRGLVVIAVAGHGQENVQLIITGTRFRPAQRYNYNSSHPPQTTSVCRPPATAASAAVANWYRMRRREDEKKEDHHVHSVLFFIRKYYYYEYYNPRFARGTRRCVVASEGK